LSGKADGHAGQKTLNAIKQFQQENSLSIDLKISEKLLSNLNLGEPRVSRQVPQNQVQNRQKSKPDIRNQDTNRNQDECIKIKREMDVYSSRVDQKDIDSIVKYDQLYKKYQKTCRNFW
jgi:peptidoglycan hydrolase-like protein with peptidoglycan-binding domain